MSVSSSITCRSRRRSGGGGRTGGAPETTAASIRPTSTRRTACASKFLENKNQSAPIRSEHVHVLLPQAAIPQSQAWYAKIFGAKASQRNNAPVADIPGVQLRFAKAESAQDPAKGRILDHIGFDVKDLKAFIKTLEANNSKLDRPYTVNDSGVDIAFITDPWGAYIEINERPAQGLSSTGQLACSPVKIGDPASSVPGAAEWCRGQSRNHPHSRGRLGPDTLSRG
jgi:predicted enzyme related to lactoylglutathione lyase